MTISYIFKSDYEQLILVKMKESFLLFYMNIIIFICIRVGIRYIFLYANIYTM